MELDLLRWRSALAGKDLTSARRAAESVAELLNERCFQDQLDRALRLVEQDPTQGTAAECIHAIAAQRLLGRLEGKLAQSPPHSEPEDVDASDWRILADAHRRLFDAGPIFQASFEPHWKPGSPAFDLLQWDGAVVSCAWCGRYAARNGHWIIDDGAAPGAPPPLDLPWHLPPLLATRHGQRCAREIATHRRASL